MKASDLKGRKLSAVVAIALSSMFATGLCAQGAATPSDEIFKNGFQPAGFAVPLAAPEGADDVYTAQVTIGNQTFALDIDTGSTTLGVAGAACTSGCTGVSPLYSPSASAMSTGASASASYADGSGWSGPVFADTVSLGNGSPAVTLDLVEMTRAKSFFDGTNGYQGILGLGPQQNAEAQTTGYIPALVGANLDDVLAFDLCDTTGDSAGTMWLGGDGSAATVQLTPLVPITGNNPFYAINVDALSLGSTPIATNAANTFKQPVIDTGTSLFYVPTTVYNTFKQTLTTSTQFKNVFGSHTLSSNGCVTDASVTDDDIASQLPFITLSLPNVLGGADFTIQANALNTYLYNAGGGQYCLAIQDGGTVDPSTFGDAFMQAFHIVIDVTDGRVGFSAPTSCVAPAFQRIRHPKTDGPRRAPRPNRL